MPTNFPELLVSNGTEQAATLKPCLACSNIHPVGYCPMKLAGVEHCGLCGMAHYGSGFSRNCPHLKSITQCRAMLEALKSSTEPPETVKQAKRYVVGILGDLNRRRKLKEAAHSIPVDTLQAPANFSNGYKPLEHQSHGHPIELPSLPFSGHPIELPAHPANRPLFEPPGDHGHFPTAPYRIN